MNDCKILSQNDIEQITELKQTAFAMPIARFRAIDFEIAENYGLFEDNKLIGMVSMTPKNLVAGDFKIKVGGIGAVATHPDARGKGVMRKLLNYSIERMREQNIPLSILWGDTQRYRHFGWETCGSKIHFRINSRSMKSCELESGFNMEPYNAQKHLEKIMDMHNAQAYRIERSKKDFEYLLSKPSVMVWYVSRGAESAYLVQEGEYIIESAGDFPLVCQSLKYLLDNYERSTLIIQKMDIDSLEQNELYKMSSWWSFEPLAMLKIIDLEKTLEVFGFEAAHSANLSRYNKLSDTEMTRLIFSGKLKLEDVEFDQLAKQIFPINIYWPRLDAI